MRKYKSAIVRTICYSALTMMFVTSVYAEKKVPKTKEDIFLDNLMKKMTTDEKIGQLNLLSSWGFLSSPTKNGKSEIMEMVENGEVGALYGYKNVSSMRRMQNIALSTKNKIPYFFGLDVIHGLETSYPTPLAMSCSWNTDLVEQYARHAALEANSLGVNWVFSPMVDIAHDARWGRVVEGAGEDPYLGGMMARAYVKGYQGDGDFSKVGNVMTCIKHYALYGAVEAGRDYNSVIMDRQTMFNNYMRPYYEACKAGAASYMTSFNEVEGIPATVNSYLINNVLRKQWGFKGFVVTDATAIKELTIHGIGNLQTTSARSLKAGVDMDMNSLGFLKTLRKSLAEGKVKQTDIDQACRRILKAKYDCGLFEDPFRFLNSKRARANVYNTEMKAQSKKTADECSVLLKNDGNLLPISPEKKIAVIGPFADNPSQMQGSWSMSSHGKESISIYQGIKEATDKAGGSTTTCTGSWLMCDSTTESALVNGLLGFFVKDYKPKTVHSQPLQLMINEAVTQAKTADVVVACVGESIDMNGEGASRSDITIPDAQKILLRALKATGKPIVIILSTGRPLVLTEEDKNYPAILCTWNLGDQEGYSVADVLFGKVNPSGHLTMSFPRSVGQLPLYYNHKNTGRPLGDYEPYRKFTSCYIDVLNSPLYPFGYGMSYTTFKLSSISLSDKNMSIKNGKVIASINVTNTGSREGKETIQLYIHAKESSSTRPVKELRGFKKIDLKAGESKAVNFTLTPDDLKYYNYDLKYVCEPGCYDIMIGDNSRDVQSIVLNVK